jgi:hypothetical protein
MLSWRTEQWSLGSGQARLISRSEDGFAVDLSRGTTCLDSFFYRTRADAERLTRQLKLQYVDRLADA